MCRFIFMRRRTRRNLPISSSDNTLNPIGNTVYTGQSRGADPGIELPQRANISQSQVSQDHNQYISISAEGITQNLALVDNDLVELPIAVAHPAVSVPSTPRGLRAHNNVSNQVSPTEGDSTTPNTTLGPDWWYCHQCHNGPQGIQTPSCTGMTSAGICGHQRCTNCTTE